MVDHSRGCVLLLAILIPALGLCGPRASAERGDRIKSATFLSPLFALGPGSVENRYYYNIDFPEGHVALKSFNGEVIDEAGNPVPLHETYLHHWVVARYFQRQGTEENESRPEDHVMARNSGICQGNVNGQYFGIGSETRRTATYVPDPYGIEIGNSAVIPDGYEERWMLNVHAIDTRGVEDRLGCTECKCDLFNITVDEYGKPLTPDYKGGLRCCYDRTQCKVRDGFRGVRRNLYLRYTVKWVDWDSSVIPVKIYILDVTDTGKRSHETTLGWENGCQVEYEVEACSDTRVAGYACIDNKRTSVIMPTGGYVVYGVAHQHTGGIGSTLYGQDGRVICTSMPIYGQGEEAGDESGYIVGMTTCYPRPVSVKIANGENLVLESNYSSTRQHTGVMGLFYLMVADQTPKDMPSYHHLLAHVQEEMKLPTYAWGILALFGLAIVFSVGLKSLWKRESEDGYQPIRA